MGREQNTNQVIKHLIEQTSLAAVSLAYDLNLVPEIFIAKAADMRVPTAILRAFTPGVLRLSENTMKCGNWNKLTEQVLCHYLIKYTGNRSNFSKR